MPSFDGLTNNLKVNINENQPTGWNEKKKVHVYPFFSFLCLFFLLPIYKSEQKVELRAPVCEISTKKWRRIKGGGGGKKAYPA